MIDVETTLLPKGNSHQFENLNCWIYCFVFVFEFVRELSLAYRNSNLGEYLVKRNIQAKEEEIKTFYSTIGIKAIQAVKKNFVIEKEGDDPNVKIG